MPKGSQPATKSDLESTAKHLDERIDSAAKRLDQKIDRVAVELVKTQAEVRQIKETLGGLATKDDVSRILGAIDAFARKAESYDRTAVLHGQALTEVQTAVKDHEKRMKAVEAR